MSSRKLVGVGALLVGLVGPSCGEEPQVKADDAGVPSASASDVPVLDAKLLAAVKKVGERDGGTNEPPATGIFEPGLGDKAHPPGAPPKMEVFDDGADPKIQLHAHVPEGIERTTLVVSIGAGEQTPPPLLLDLAIGSPDAVGAFPLSGSKDKPDGKPVDGAAPSPSASAGAAVAAPVPQTLPQRKIARVVGVEVVGVPAAQVPKKFSEQIEKMKGSTISFTLTKTGPTEFSRTLGEGADPQLEIMLTAAEDALAALYVAAPDKPVGEGAYWMVTDRRASLGAEVVRYRVFKVASVDGDRATFTMTLKQYAVDDKLALPLGPELAGASVAQYAATGDAEVEVAPKKMFPTGGLRLQIQSLVVPPGAKDAPPPPPGQMRGAPINLKVMAALGVDPAQLKPANADDPKKKDGPKAPGPKAPGPKPPQPPQNPPQP